MNKAIYIVLVFNFDLESFIKLLQDERWSSKQQVLIIA